MAISFVRHVGSVSSGNSTTVIITVPAAGCQADDLLVFRMSRGETEADPSSVVDTAGNTWVKIASYLTSPACHMWASKLTSPLTSGNTITATFGAMSNRGGVVDEFSGVEITTDGTNVTNGTGTTPSAAITQVSTADLVFGAVHVDAGVGDSITEDADSAGGDTWHTLTRLDESTSTVALHAAYKITTSAVTQTYNPTLGTSRDWSEVLAAFQGTPEPLANVRPVQLSSFPRYRLARKVTV